MADSSMSSWEPWEPSGKYPEWAPKPLQAWLDHRPHLAAEPMIVENTPAGQYAVIHRLCTHPNMELVWKRLRKRYFSLAEENKRESSGAFPFDLTGAVLYGLFGKMGWDALTPAEAEKKRDQLVNQLSALAETLRDFPVSKGLFDDFTDEERGGLSSAIIVQAVCGRGLNLSGAELTDIIGTQVKKESFASASPPLDELLTRIAARISSGVHQPLIKSPNRTGADVRFFVVCVGEFLQNEFGTPLYEILANLGMAFFPDAELDENKVRFMLPL